jgi:hypothetical protein
MPVTVSRNPDGEEVLEIHHTEIENPEVFIQKAKALVTLEFNNRFPAINGEAYLEEFYVVWFCKTLQNWKALVSTDLINGIYWEVTYNGNKQETYVATYTKADNRTFPDAPVS